MYCLNTISELQGILILYHPCHGICLLTYLCQSVVLQRLGEVPRQHAKDIILLLALYREIVVPQKTWAQNLLFQPRVSEEAV